MAGPWVPNLRRARPEIAIVGAGLAGLTAAYRLQQKGHSFSILEARERPGGRVLSAKGPNGELIEYGAELIDEDHSRIRALAKELGVALDRETTEREPVFRVANKHRTDPELTAALQTVVRAIARDRIALDYRDYRRHNRRAKQLDALSVEDYLDRRGISGWIRELIRKEMESEFGTHASQLSALSLIYFMEPGMQSAFDEFGVYGPQLRIRGGSSRLIEALAVAIREPVRYGRKLVAVRRVGTRLELSFESGPSELTDRVLLTLPLSTLRQVDLGVELGEVRSRALQEIRYGTNAKVIGIYSNSPWRESGLSGWSFGSPEVQSSWQYPGQPVLHVFNGGEAGQRAARATEDRLRETVFRELGRILPGSAAPLHITQHNWIDDPLSLGTYAALGPGQYTSLAGCWSPILGLYFAGEHTDIESQGYMDGAVRSGERAARELMR